MIMTEWQDVNMIQPASPQSEGAGHEKAVPPGSRTTKENVMLTGLDLGLDMMGGSRGAGVEARHDRLTPVGAILHPPRPTCADLIVLGQSQ